MLHMSKYNTPNHNNIHNYNINNLSTYTYCEHNGWRNYIRTDNHTNYNHPNIYNTEHHLINNTSTNYNNFDHIHTNNSNDHHRKYHGRNHKYFYYDYPHISLNN